MTHKCPYLMAAFPQVLRASKLQEMAKKHEFLKTHPAFLSLSDEVLKKFVDNAVIKSYKPSEVGPTTILSQILILLGPNTTFL